MTNLKAPWTKRIVGTWEWHAIDDDGGQLVAHALQHAELIRSLPELKEQRDELLRACEAAEWGGPNTYGPMCPVCNGLQLHDGHEESCRLKAAIEKAKGG